MVERQRVAGRGRWLLAALLLPTVPAMAWSLHQAGTHPARIAQVVATAKPSPTVQVTPTTPMATPSLTPLVELLGHLPQLLPADRYVWDKPEAYPGPLAVGGYDPFAMASLPGSASWPAITSYSIGNLSLAVPARAPVWKLAPLPINPEALATHFGLGQPDNRNGSIPYEWGGGAGRPRLSYDPTNGWVRWTEPAATVTSLTTAAGAIATTRAYLAARGLTPPAAELTVAYLASSQWQVTFRHRALQGISVGIDSEQGPDLAVLTVQGDQVVYGWLSYRSIVAGSWYRLRSWQQAWQTVRSGHWDDLLVSATSSKQQEGVAFHADSVSLTYMLCLPGAGEPPFDGESRDFLVPAYVFRDTGSGLALVISALAIDASFAMPHPSPVP